MAQISIRTAAATFAALGILAASDLFAGERVVVRVYDTDHVASDARPAAITIAASILEEAGITVEWRDCTERSAQPPCQRSDPRRDLIVRIMPALTAQAAALRNSGVAVETLGDPQKPLGLAALDPITHTGQLVTVFYEQVRAVVDRTGVDRRTLLGRTLAHEVGHLLLGVLGHSRSGLMRAIWTDAEIASNRLSDWLFAPEDLRRLRRNVSTSGDRLVQPVRPTSDD